MLREACSQVDEPWISRKDAKAQRDRAVASSFASSVRCVAGDGVDCGRDWLGVRFKRRGGWHAPSASAGRWISDMTGPGPEDPVSAAERRARASEGARVCRAVPSVDVGWGAEGTLYIGKEKDEETGLAYHSARYYASWLGRWCSSDPAGLVDGVGRYAYCGGRPVGSKDGSGLTEELGKKVEALFAGPLQHIGDEFATAVAYNPVTQTVMAGMHEAGALVAPNERVAAAQRKKADRAWKAASEGTKGTVEGAMGSMRVEEGWNLGTNLQHLALAWEKGTPADVQDASGRVYESAEDWVQKLGPPAAAVIKGVRKGAARGAKAGALDAKPTASSPGTPDTAPSSPPAGLARSDVSSPEAATIDASRDPTPATSRGTETLYRAPRAEGQAERQLAEGFDPADFTAGDQCCYVSRDRAVAETFSEYGPYDGRILEVEVDGVFFDANLAGRERSLHLGDLGDTTEIPIPSPLLDEVNQNTVARRLE